MKDFFAFRTMLMPVLIQIIFWIGVIACAAAGVYMIAMPEQATARMGSGMTVQMGGAGAQGAAQPLDPRVAGIILIIVGPIVVRLWCEMMIIFFRMNGTLTEIKNALASKESED